MDVSYITQLILNGLFTGLNYILIASGFSLVFGISRIFNFAHGEFYMLGAFAIFVALDYVHMNYFVAIVLSAALLFALGYTVEVILFRSIRKEMYASFMVSLGLNFSLATSALLVFGERMKGVNTVFAGVADIFGARISWEKVVAMCACLIVLIALHLFVKVTRWGKAFRAVSDDSEAAALQGISVNRICSLSFALGCGLAAIAGAILLPVTYVDPFVGGGVIFKVIVVVILGGLGSMAGAAVGGMVLGFVDSLGLTFLGNPAHIVGWIIVMVLLLIRPYGLLGEKE